MTFPSWIKDPVTAYSHPLEDDDHIDRIVRSIVENLPIDRLIRALGGPGGPLEHLTGITVRAAVAAVVEELSKDAEVKTLTQLYDDARRALDRTGAPYADAQGDALDLPARIRWLDEQRPTRLDLEREANVAAQDLAIAKRIADERGALIARLQLELVKADESIKGLEERIAELESRPTCGHMP
jgi:hypothetical protein